MTFAELETIIEGWISKLGVHLVELAQRGEGNGRSIEIYIDSEQGITTEICSEVSKEVDRLIASSGMVRGSYRLTVSSPGISRPLKYPWQYTKHVGRELDVSVTADAGIRRVTGKLESATETGITLRVGSKGEPESILLDKIVEARVRAPW